MIIIIDNTKNLEQAKMTPKIVSILHSKNIRFRIVKTKHQLVEIIETSHIKNAIKGIILSGGPLFLSQGCLYDDISKNVLALTVFDNIPILGICFGFQIISDLYGGTIGHLQYKNKITKNIVVENSELSLLPNGMYSLCFSHQDYVKSPPKGFKFLKKHNKIIAIENVALKRYGFQFHPEGTRNGSTLITRFLQKCI